MSQTRDQYLRELGSNLACFARSRDLAAEVAMHLDDSTDHLERRGLRPDDAMAEAMARLGHPAEIAAAFTANDEPLAIPTRFTRIAGRLALLALPAWIAAVGFMFASDITERWYEWDALPQDLWTLGALSMLLGSICLLVSSIGLYRRSGGLGKVGAICIALLALAVVATPLAWFIPGWGTVMTLALAMLAFRLRARHSPFAHYAALAAVGPALALIVFLLNGDSGGWSVSFAFMLIPAAAIAALGLRLMHEPDISVPGPTLA